MKDATRGKTASASRRKTPSTHPGKTLSTSRRTRRREILGKTVSKAQIERRRPGSQFLRFKDAKGKTVEFVEVGTGDDPCVEIGFDDKTALLFILDTDTRLTIEPSYSDWKTGNARLLRRWGPR